MKTFNKTNLYRLLICCALGAGFSACSLDENNPGGFTMEASAKTEQGYQQIINQCYFALERRFYGTEPFIYFTEGNTDLWTTQANKSTSYTQYLWFFAGAAPNTTYTNDLWSAIYDGIGSCNNAIALAPLAPITDDKRNALVAQARFLRAVYYFNAVEQFGGVTVILEPAKDVDYNPQRTAPLEVYKNVIIPDLEYAVKYLDKGTDALNTIPTKKSALGFLAKAYLQTVEYDATKEYAAKALETAKLLITDAESGGATYNAYMYPKFEDVFAEANNWANKEALWKHRWYAGADGSGSSNGNYKLNRYNEYFYCKFNNFGAREDVQATRITWGGNQPGTMMPTQHLLSLFVQSDGTVDPRFAKSFQTTWLANKKYTWNQGDAAKYDRVTSVVGSIVNVGDTAIRVIMPFEADYAQLAAAKLSKKYLVVDYKDIYNDASNRINMTYSYQNPSGSYTADGKAENLFNYFYPSLTKFNSSRYYVADAGKMRNGNLNSIFMMRMAEVYLIAAEADLYVNNGANALGYVNTIRNRAGAKPLSGEVSLRAILDERARELCGEDTRFYDLKRTGMYLNNNYLLEVDPDLAAYFKPEYALRPISTSFTSVLTGGGSYYQNPGY